MTKWNVTMADGRRQWLAIDPNTNAPMDEIWQQLYQDDLSGGLTDAQIERLEEWADMRHGATEDWVKGLIATIRKLKRDAGKD